MLRNYLIVAWRNLVRHKLNSCINLLGLSLAIGCCLLVFLFVRFEWTYDAFHEQADRIYRLRLGGWKGGPPWVTSDPDAALGPLLTERLPGVQRSVRLAFEDFAESWWETGPAESNVTAIVDSVDREMERRLLEEGRWFFGETRLYVDPSFFEVFTFPLLKGDPATALRARYGVVLTERAAQKYFGAEDPLGKNVPVRFKDRYEFDLAKGEWVAVYATRHYTVMGIAQDPPPNSSIQFDLLFPFEAQPREVPACGAIYLLLAEGADPRQLEALLPDLMRPYLKPYQLEVAPELQPIEKLYLDQRKESPVNLSYPYILASIGLAILVVACINFVNLTLAQAASRAREIGVRQVVGARRWQLMQQFWGETVLLSLLAVGGGMAMAEVFLPAFKLLVQRPLRLDVTSGEVALAGLGLALLVGVLAGAYPAAAMSGFRPVAALRGAPRLGGRSSFSRGLIVLQFGLAIFLVVAALTMRGQVRYMKSRSLGFARDQVVQLSLSGEDKSKTLDLLKNELSSHPEILGMTKVSIAPGGGYALSDWKWEGAGIGAYSFRVDSDFITTLGLELVAGRDFREDLPTDRTEAVIINQALAQRLGWKDPVGRVLTGWNRPDPRTEQDTTQAAELLVPDPRVIGVVKDFHYFPVQRRIAPAVLYLAPLYPGFGSEYHYALVRLQAQDIPGGMEVLRQAWRHLWPERVFIFNFLSDNFASRYREEERWTRLIDYACGLAVLIACLGLFGLVALVIDRRTKEIGIRKVLGASVPSIVMLLSREFTCLVLAANLIAWPIAWYAMHRWLQSFAYRIDLGPGVFVLGGLVALGIAWVTVSYQAIRAALANPVEALRYE